MLDLPVPHNGNGAQPLEVAQAVAQGIRQRDEQAASAASAASAAARNGATPTVAAASTPRPTGPLMPPADENATAAQSQAAGESEAPPAEATTWTESGAPEGVADAESAAFIGNIHTMVYHAADADDLPAEENRIYFASEDEAHERGYRRARDEVSSGGE